MLIRCPVGGSVGGCGARALSRKTPIYFIIIQCLFFKLCCLFDICVSYNTLQKMHTKDPNSYVHSDYFGLLSCNRKV